jgi:hypothetical protein
VGLARNGKVLHPATVWVPALLGSMAQDRLPHLLIVGESRGGKTTVARAIMSIASNHFGARLVVLDPHTKEGDYPVSVTGRHRNFAAINHVMGELVEEFNWRFDQDHHDHEPLLIFIDEWPSIADSKECPLAAEFLQTLAREAGKIHMHLFILTTSPLVEDLKVNSATRRNFSKVLVGYYARQLLPEAFTKSERYATALEHKGHKLALGSFDTKELASVPIAKSCLWQLAQVRTYAKSLALPREYHDGALKIQRPLGLTPFPPTRPGEKEKLAPEGEALLKETFEWEAQLARTVDADTYLKIAGWVYRNPDISAKEVARRLFGKDYGRYCTRAGILLSRVKAVTGVGVTAGEDGPNGLKTVG